MKMLWSVVLLLVVGVVSSIAETPQPDRIAGAIHNTPSVVLKGNVHPKAQPQYDQGPVEPSMKLGYITLVLQASAAQQADAKNYLAELQNPSSPNYHNWLTPEQYADRFGVSRNDVNKITKWLQAQGFVVIQPARGRNWVAFSGNAELVSKVFQTEIHYYDVDGEKHFANATNPSIPKALSGIAIGFRGLNNFAPKPMGLKQRPKIGSASPDYSNGFSGNNLAPADIATIYGIQALYSAGYTGSGQKIVVVGQTDIDTTDIANFRAGFGLSTTLPTSMLVTGDTDPGITGDLGEADLDLEWAGAVAPNASILFVIGNAMTGGGVFDSAQFAIDNNLAPVISMSYGGCESDNVNFIPFFEPILKMASMEGITFLASSGDSGAAGCDSDQHNPSASHGLAVNYPASSPEVTGVGGNEFNEGAGTYWGSNGGNLGSALSYIPEMAWNDTALNNSLSGSGGGQSSCGVESAGVCTGGFPKPTWQTGTGVPNDAVRDVPDVSLTASADHDGYIFCTQTSCASGVVGSNGPTAIVGGTSASTPVFAGIVALLNDYVVANGVQAQPGLGNINTMLYQLAQGSSGSTIFHDVTTGDNIVPCTQGTTGCPATAPFQYGYSAGVGYDQVTGLGSVNADNLAIGFAGQLTKTSTTTTLALSGSSIQAGASVTFTATVTQTGGTTAPTGTVTFLNGTTTLGTGTLSASGTNATATFTTTSLAGGTYSVTASYAGDTNYTGSASSASTLTVQDFTLTPAAQTVSVMPGAPGSATLTATALGGFTGTIAYACPTAGVPSEATCTATATSTGATISFTTTAATSQLLFPGRSRGFFYAMLLPGMLGLVFAGRRKNVWRATRILSLIVILGLSTLWMGACGGGGSSTSGNPGTPAGSYPLTITATSGTLSHTATVTLTVQ